jgi:hypothetical protein
MEQIQAEVESIVGRLHVLNEQLCNERMLALETLDYFLSGYKVLHDMPILDVVPQVLELPGFLRSKLQCHYHKTHHVPLRMHCLFDCSILFKKEDNHDRVRWQLANDLFWEAMESIRTEEKTFFTNLPLLSKTI